MSDRNHITSAGLIHISGCSMLNLKHLSISNFSRNYLDSNRIGARGALFLSRANWPVLNTLSLSTCVLMQATTASEMKDSSLYAVLDGLKYAGCP